MNPEQKEINPVQLVYMSFQIRQLELYRNSEKQDNKRQAMTLQIRKLKADLDPLLSAFAEQEKAKHDQPQMALNTDLGDKDLGPQEVVDSLHAYAKTKITQQEAVNYLSKGHPISVAGEFNEVAYVIHFQQTKAL